MDVIQDIKKQVSKRVKTIVFPEGTEEPPQGIDVRVTGILQQKEFTIIGEVFYILATKVEME